MCGDTCSTSTYPNITTSKCESCNAACSSCTGPLNSECSACSSNYYLYSTTCSIYCPTGYYKDSSECKECDDACKTCTSLIVCTSCNSGYFYYNG